MGTNSDGRLRNGWKKDLLLLLAERMVRNESLKLTAPEIAN